MHTHANGRTAGRTSDTSEGVVLDVELAALMKAWPSLPDPIKAAIRALIGSTSGS